MFEFLFKYPRAVFAKGDLVLLGAWPRWVLVIVLLAAAAGLAWLIRSKLPEASTQVRNWKAASLLRLELTRPSDHAHNQWLPLGVTSVGPYAYPTLPAILEVEGVSSTPPNEVAS